MVTVQGFTALLEACSALLPYARPLPEAAYAISWASFPDQARRELSDADLAWAVGQYIQDPRRDSYPEPVHLALLRYLYRVGDGRPRLDWGLRWPAGPPQSSAFMGSRAGDGSDPLIQHQDTTAAHLPPPDTQLAAVIRGLAADGSRTDHADGA